MSRQHDPRTLYGLGLRPHTIPPCPHCGGHLFLEADPQRNTSALVCLLCARTPGIAPRPAVLEPERGGYHFRRANGQR